jgi:hypothetical protein
MDYISATMQGPGVHFDSTSCIVVMCVNNVANTYTRVNQQPFLVDKPDLAKSMPEVQKANFVGAPHIKLKGFAPSINPNRPPKNTT